MKTKLILRIMGLLILITSMFELSSCSKAADESLTKEQKELQDSNTVVSTIDQKDITESDEDLTTVDYKEFYDQLSPYGEWVKVKLDDIGLKPKTASIKSSGDNGFTISNLLNIKTAYADDANLAMTFVWRPSSEFAVVGSVGETPQYTPYNNGQWVNTDAGWYFRAPTPWEETVHHHGRWVHSRDDGWLWVPGRVWAPAWVDWRQDDDYVSWAPLRPSVYFSAGNFGNSDIDDDDYYMVERRHFIDPDIYRYSSPYYESGNRISMSLMIGTVGLVFDNNMIINRGPDVNIIQNYYTTNINMINIRHVRNFNDVRYSDNYYNVYSPEFKRYKNKEHPEYRKNEPKSYKGYDEWRGKNAGQRDNNKESRKEEKGFKNENKGNDNGNKHDSKVNGKKNSGTDNVKYNKGNNNVKQNKGNDNVKQNKGNNNVKQNKGNNNVKQNKGNNNVKQNKGNENVKQNKGNNNVKQNKGNDKGNQQKGNDKGNQQKGNDKGNQQKGNDKGNQQKGNDKGNQQKGNDKGNQQKGNDNGKGKK